LASFRILASYRLGFRVFGLEVQKVFEITIGA